MKSRTKKTFTKIVILILIVVAIASGITHLTTTNQPNNNSNNDPYYTDPKPSTPIFWITALVSILGATIAAFMHRKIKTETFEQPTNQIAPTQNSPQTIEQLIAGIIQKDLGKIEHSLNLTVTVPIDKTIQVAGTDATMQGELKYTITETPKQPPTSTPTLTPETTWIHKGESSLIDR